MVFHDHRRRRLFIRNDLVRRFTRKRMLDRHHKIFQQKEIQMKYLIASLKHTRESGLYTPRMKQGLTLDVHPECGETMDVANHIQLIDGSWYHENDLVATEHDDPVTKVLETASDETIAMLSKTPSQHAMERSQVFTKGGIKPDEYDMVNPSHYKDKPIETIEKMRRIWGDEMTSIYCDMTAFKYRERIGDKPGQPLEQEIKKIKWYESKSKELRSTQPKENQP